MNRHSTKEQYEALTASDALKNRVSKIMKRERRRDICKRVLTSAAGVLLALIVAFNLSPHLSAWAMDIPVIGSIVRVITFNKYEFHENGYNAEIIIPEISGLLDPELEARLNAELHENAAILVDQFEQDYLALKQEFGDELVHLSVMSDYTVKTDNERVLSIDTYTYSEVVGFQYHTFYTIDKQTGTRVTLPDLFAPGAEYVTPISAYIVGEMERYNAEVGRVYYVGDNDDVGSTFTAIDPEQHFYIDSEGRLVICFEKYSVAAGYMRSPEFAIPTEVIRDILISSLIQ